MKREIIDFLSFFFWVLILSLSYLTNGFEKTTIISLAFIIYRQFRYGNK